MKTIKPKTMQCNRESASALKVAETLMAIAEKLFAFAQQRAAQPFAEVTDFLDDDDVETVSKVLRVLKI